jgi:putative ABC transport system permease protein
MTRVHVTPWGAVTGGAFRANAGRLALSVAAIALGVALGYAVQLINQAAVNELSAGLATVTGDADLEIRGPRAGFDERLFVDAASLPEVALASPVVEVDAKLAMEKGELAILGIDVFRAGPIQPGLVGESEDRLDTLRPDAIFLSTAAADALGVKRGDSIAVLVGLTPVRLRVAGLLSAQTTGRLGVMDIAAAQDRFGRIGRITRVDLRLRPGTDIDAVRTSLQATLPPGVAVEKPAASLRAVTSLSRAYRVNLNVLALVALFTGGLLVFSTQALAVVRRRTQLALLRVLGMKRRELARTLVAEGAIVGAAGATLGLIAGYALAAIAVRLFGSDLGAGYFRGVQPRLGIEPWSALLFFVLGMAAAVLGSLVPALEAARAQPGPALKAGDEQRALERLRTPWPGLVLWLLGLAASSLPPVRGLPVFGYVAIACLLVGTIMLMPRVAHRLLLIAPRPRAVPGALALDQLRGAPGQASVSLAAVVASVSLMVSMAIMVASFRQSVDDWLERVLPADLYVRASMSTDTAYLSPIDLERLALVPGVRRIEPLRSQQILLDADRASVALLAKPVDATDPTKQLPIVGSFVVPKPGDPPPAWVTEPMVDIYGFAVGQRIELPIAGRMAPFLVAGVWRDYARQQGAIMIQRDTLVSLTDDANANAVAFWLAPGAQRDDVSRAVVAAIPGGGNLEVATPGEIRDVSLTVFDRTFAVTYALEAAAVLIGLFGLSSSFGALVLARRREFGVLRHLGMTRGQIGAMLAAEGFAVSVVGLAVGLAVGWLISLILIYVVNRQSFHWGMELHVPWAGLAVLGAVLLTLATLTALVSGRQAMGSDVVRAVKDDW